MSAALLDFPTARVSSDLEEWCEADNVRVYVARIRADTYRARATPDGWAVLLPQGLRIGQRDALLFDALMEIRDALNTEHPIPGHGVTWA